MSDSPVCANVHMNTGGLPPDSVCEEEPEVLEDMQRLIDEFHDNSKCVQ